MLSLGISIAYSRFQTQLKMSKKIQKIKENRLTAVEFGLLNCVLGRSNIPGTVPYPTENQVKTINEILPSDHYYLSVHGPYRISATTEEPKKLQYSKSNLSKSLLVADWLGCHHVTFHGGSFKKKHNNLHVQKVLNDWEVWRQKKGYKAKMAPEIGGKYNSFADFFTLVEIAGTIDNCIITWDISHDFARGGNVTSESGILKRLELLDQFDLNEKNRLPIHFSGMKVGKAGEKHHTLLDYGTGVPWKLVFSVLKEQNFLRKVSLICESKVPKNEKLQGSSITDALRLRQFIDSDKIVKDYKGKSGHLDFYFGKKSDTE
ncbi:MAG: TIM barrel protein [Candidatus Hodarchaeales archaeon]|jgi:deoxyribonuclease-4